MGRTSHVNVNLRKLFSLGTDPEPVNLGRGEGMCVWGWGSGVELPILRVTRIAQILEYLDKLHNRLCFTSSVDAHT